MKRQDIAELIVLAGREGALTNGERRNLDRIAADFHTEIQAEEIAKAEEKKALEDAARMESERLAAEQKAIEEAREQEEQEAAEKLMETEWKPRLAGVVADEVNGNGKAKK